MAPSRADLYELFWENSKLNAATVRPFSTRIGSYPASPVPRPLRFPTPDIFLERPRDALARLMARRKSDRVFSDAPVSPRQLGRLFGAFACSSGRSRTFASAGATYPVEIFCLLNNVDSSLTGHAVYYNSDRHSLSVVDEIPAWERYADAVNIETVGVPQLVFVFVVVAERTTHKYGERGGRFALIEVGHAAQNLALRLAEEGMVGCIAGGLYDDAFRALLRLEAARAHVALGYVCGLAPRERRGLRRALTRVSFKTRA
jgi:SagB-type dehydrogenase family enzyme